MSKSESLGIKSPRNPVFMFLAGGGSTRQGSRTVFSIPGPTAEDLEKSSKTKPGIKSTGSPVKKRSRQPPLPFRLPTDDEERIALDRAINGPSSTSGGGIDIVMTSPPITIEKLSITRRRNLEAKTATSNAIHRLFNYVTGNRTGSGVEQSECIRATRSALDNNPREITSAEIEKCLKWIRGFAPDLFWTPFDKSDTTQLNELKCFEIVHNAVSVTAFKFVSVVEKLMKPGDYIKCGGRKLEAFRFLCQTISGILLSSDKQRDIPCGVVEDIFEKFYSYGFRALMKIHERTAEDAMEVDTVDIDGCEGCSDNPCVCSKVANLFAETNLAIQGLGLMDELAGPRLYSVVRREMVARVEEVGTDEVDVSHIEGFKRWLNYRVTPWIDTIYPHLKNNNSSTDKFKMKEDFQLMMVEVYGKSIIKNLFAIIIEFPDSQPILDDLKICMKEVNLRNDLVSSLKSSLERRLLNAGVNTSDVLEAYVSTVRALKYIDTTGILVQLVTPPVREYLKHREETVRVILVSLTEESGELSDELARNPTNLDKKNKVNMDNWRTWEPDPIDVPKDKNNLRKSDLIEALVSIYGSKTVFIDEYRALLADRLLRLPKPGSITREIKCLELLKLRFGESDLQKCEVMLKDVGDSQRLNTRFYEEEGAVLANETVHVTGLVVSAQFWPTFKQEELVLPKPVVEALEKYTKAFEMIKGNRTLEWQKHIGTVELEIEHGGNVVSFSVTPLQATLIYHFQEKEKWTLDELAKATGTSASLLNNRMSFWVSKGIITHVGQGVYALSDSVSEGSQATGVIPNKYVEETESDSPMASTSSQRATELQMFWSYIEAMLTNLESLPLPRIHSMLKLFATVECSSDELQKFLDEKVSQNLLVYSTGQYQLPK